MEISCKFKQFSWKKRKAGHPGDITQRNGSEQVVPALGLEQPGHHLGSISQEERNLEPNQACVISPLAASLNLISQNISTTAWLHLWPP